MTEHIRKTQNVVQLIDIDDEMPSSGTLVLAIGLGGKLCEEVWSSKSHEFFKAWCPYPKVPRSVKEKLLKNFPFEGNTNEV